MTGTTLRDAALQAEKDSARADRQRRADQREASLTELLDKWETRARIGYTDDKPTLPKPERDQFTWNGYPGHTYGGYGRADHVHGWTWETDGVPFLYDATYSGQGLCVLLTCPDCGETHADSPHSMEELGRLLRLNRGRAHECRTVAVQPNHPVRFMAQPNDWRVTHMTDPTDNHVAAPTGVRRFWISEPEMSVMRDHDGQHCEIVRTIADGSEDKFLVRFADGHEGIAFADELHQRGSDRP